MVFKRSIILGSVPKTIEGDLLITRIKGIDRLIRVCLWSIVPIVHIHPLMRRIVLQVPALAA